MGIASLVLGIVGFISCFLVVTAPIGLIGVIVGLVLGIVDVARKSKRGQNRGAGISGIVICAITFLILVVETFIVGMGLAIFNEAGKSLENNINWGYEEDYSNSINNYWNDSNNYQTNNLYENNDIYSNTTNTIGNNVVNNSIYSNSINNNTVDNNVTNNITNNNTIDNQAVQNFNMPFKAYEGTRTGTSVKNLLQLINNNNLIHDRKITVYFEGQVQDTLTVRESIFSSHQYTVTFASGTDWYFNRVNIIQAK